MKLNRMLLTKSSVSRLYWMSALVVTFVESAQIARSPRMSAVNAPLGKATSLREKEGVSEIAGMGVHARLAPQLVSVPP